MSSPITPHQRDLSNLAIVIAQQQDTIDGLLKSYETIDKSRQEYVAANESLSLERAELLTENASLRTDINGLEAVIHELIEDRWWRRYHSRNDSKVAHSRVIDLDNARSTITELRAELARLKNGKRR